jgi:hypothetical protein
MEKARKTVNELEAMVLAELQATDGCEGARHVTIIAYDDCSIPATWEVASFNPGISKQEDCERAVGEIVSRLQKRFDIAADSRTAGVASPMDS